MAVSQLIGEHLILRILLASMDISLEDTGGFIYDNVGLLVLVLAEYSNVGSMSRENGGAPVTHFI